MDQRIQAAVSRLIADATARQAAGLERLEEIRKAKEPDDFEPRSGNRHERRRGSGAGPPPVIYGKHKRMRRERRIALGHWGSSCPWPREAARLAKLMQPQRALYVEPDSEEDDEFYVLTPAGCDHLEALLVLPYNERRARMRAGRT